MKEEVEPTRKIQALAVLTRGKKYAINYLFTILEKKKANWSISIIAWKVKQKWLYAFQLSKKKQGQTSENLSWWDCGSYYCWKKTQEKKSHFNFFKTEKLKRFKHFSARRWGLHQISHDAFQLYTLIMEKNI